MVLSGLFAGQHCVDRPRADSRAESIFTRFLFTEQHRELRRASGNTAPKTFIRLCVRSWLWPEREKVHSWVWLLHGHADEASHRAIASAPHASLSVGAVGGSVM